MNDQNNIWVQRRKRMAEIIDVASSGDWISQGYDIVSTILLLINLVATLMDTFDALSQYHKVL